MIELPVHGVNQVPRDRVEFAANLAAFYESWTPDAFNGIPPSKLSSCGLVQMRGPTWSVKRSSRSLPCRWCGRVALITPQIWRDLKWLSQRREYRRSPSGQSGEASELSINQKLDGAKAGRLLKPMFVPVIMNRVRASCKEAKCRACITRLTACKGFIS